MGDSANISWRLTPTSKRTLATHCRPLTASYATELFFFCHHEEAAEYPFH